MASVISTLKPAPRRRQEDEREESISLLQFDRAGELLASSGSLFDALGENKSARDGLLLGWKTALGIDICFESLIDQTRAQIVPLSIPNASNARHQIAACEISIIPQFSAADSSVSGVSVIFRPTQGEPKLAAGEIDFELASLALQSSDQAFWFWKPEADELYEYGPFSALAGFGTRTPLSSQHAFQERCHPDDAASIRDAMVAHLRGTTKKFDITHRYKDEAGNYRWLKANGMVAARDQHGKATLVVGVYADVTAEREKALELARIQPRFELALQSARQTIWEWDVATDRVLTSAYENGLTEIDNTQDYTKAEYINAWIHPGDRRAAFDMFEALNSGKISQLDLEQRCRQIDGTYRWFSVRGGVLNRDENGQITLIGGIHSDISDLKKSQEALEDKIRLQSLTLDSSRVSLWEWFPGKNGRIELSGIWREQLNCKNRNGLTSTDEFAQLVHPDDVSDLNIALEDCLNGNQETLELEYRLQNRDGMYIHILSRGRVAESDDSGHPTRVIGTITDIHELKLHQTRLDLALANGRQALWEWQSDRNLLILSESWHALFGYEINEVAKFTPDFSDLLHPEDFSTVSKSFGMLLQNPQHIHRVEYRLRHKQGHYLWVADQGVVVERDATGKALKAIGSQVDISAHRDAMQEARDARVFLQLILDEIPDKIFWKDSKHRLLGCNKAYAEILGASSPTDVIGQSTGDLYPADLAQMYENDDDEVLNSGIPMLGAERHAIDYRGREFWIESTKLPLTFNHDGHIEKGLLCHFRDITLERARRKQLETLASIMTTDSAHRVLDRLVSGTAELAQVDIVFIGRINAEDGTVTVVASHTSGDSLDGVTYRFQDTPCESILEENLCIYNTNVQHRFPKDLMLGELGITSYVGRRLLDNHGKVVGIFVVMNNDAIANLHQTTSLIDIVSSTAAYELIRETRENALIESEKRYRNIYDSVPVMICTTDKDHKIQDINSTWIETTGYIHSDIVGKPLCSLFNDLDRCSIEEGITKAWQGEEHDKEGYLGMVGADGEEIFVKHNAVYTASAGSDGVTINVFEDMREWYESAQQLRLAATAFETHEALLIRDNQMKVLRVNAAFTEVTGFEQAEIIHSNFEYFTADDGEDIWQVARTAGKWDGNGKCQRVHGGSFSAYQTVTAVKDDSGQLTHFVENFNDITDYVEALAETERLAYFDSLTELPNRRQLSERLAQSLSSAKRHKTFGAVMFIDLDHFKNINDAVGHSVGDLVLQQVSKRLLKILREEDTIARLGGDEFVVLIPNISSSREEAQTQAVLIAEKVQRDLRRLYYLDDHEFHITPTMGVTLFPDQQDSVDDVLKQADTAMYRAKAEGRNQTKFYDESMLDSARERLSIEKDLRTAVQRGEFHLVFQPQVRADGTIFGAEALLRWRHPTKGLVSPVVFIPIAEETGLIIEIGRWVLEEAFSALAHWNEIFPAQTLEHLSVNVSSRQFSGHDFVEDVARRLKKNGTDPKKVVLEVTESTVIDKIQATVSKMEELKGLGVRFSVDDFGTGYSSLAYLSRLPLDQLKIDRTFVANIHDDPANAVIVETIISMGRHLGLQTVAEGVETEAQLQFLDERHCNAYQGYYFAKPLEIDEFESYLRKQITNNP